MQLRRKGLLGAAVVASAMTMVVATAPSLSFGADHADAPGNLQSPSSRPDADINDVYAFSGGSGQTVLAMTTHPAVGVLSPSTYATDVEYVLNVDRRGTAHADRAYALRFGNPDRNGAQSVRVYQYDGSHAESISDGQKIAEGTTGQSFTGSGGIKVFAGLRSDPFFFDLDGFKHAVFGAANGRTGFCDAGTTDFFKNFNTNAIVLSVPTSSLTTTSPKFGVWGSTLMEEGNALIDQMGRPAINTVFNHDDEKNQFNHTRPANQLATKPFANNIIWTVAVLGGYDLPHAQGIARTLLPDILTYDTSQPATFLNGRKLTDDVINTELGLVTNGGITTDCVGPHGDYQSSFPYLGTPHP
jgi:hypothetical protein